MSLMSKNCPELLLSSSLQNHMLYSVIPQEFKLYQQAPFKKTIDFYKPEQFIWNNPHRTSNKMYQYYHKDNDKYKKIKQKQIKMLQIQDRQYRQSHRIKNLSLKRDQTRNKFYSRRIQNKKLQQKPRNIKKCLASEQCLTEIFDNSLYQEFDKFNKVPSKSLKQTSYSQNCKSLEGRNFYKKQISKNQQTFLDSLKKSDKQKQKLVNIVKIHKQNMYKKLRQQFARQKQQNWKRNEKVYNLNTQKLQSIR